MTNEYEKQNPVTHNEAQNRFELRAEGQLAKADYRRLDNTLVFTHTFVPGALRGRGIAARIVRAGLDYARSENLSVLPQCSYVAAFIERNPEYHSLRASSA